MRVYPKIVRLRKRESSEPHIVPIPKRLSTSPVKEINRLHEELLEIHKAATEKVTEKAIRIGALLTQQKAKLKHGQWLPWIEANLGFSPDWAQNYLRVYKYRDRLPKTDSCRYFSDLLALVSSTSSVEVGVSCEDRMVTAVGYPGQDHEVTFTGGISTTVPVEADPESIDPPQRNAAVSRDATDDTKTAPERWLGYLDQTETAQDSSTETLPEPEHQSSREPLFGEFTATELGECARRELGQRKRVYRRLVGEDKMSQADADREIAMMQAIADHFERGGVSIVESLKSL